MGGSSRSSGHRQESFAFFFSPISQLWRKGLMKRLFGRLIHVEENGPPPTKLIHYRLCGWFKTGDSQVEWRLIVQQKTHSNCVWLGKLVQFLNLNVSGILVAFPYKPTKKGVVLSWRFGRYFFLLPRCVELKVSKVHRPTSCPPHLPI